jgi:hypothetical protein
MNTNSVKELLLKNFKGIQRGTNFILKTVPTDKLDYQPNKDMRKMGEIAMHIATLPLSNTFLIENEFKERPNPELSKKLFEDKFGSAYNENNFPVIFEKACEYFIDFYNKKTDVEFFTNTFTNFIYTKPTSFLQGFLSVEDHIVQHRGTLFAYLRLLNIPVTMMQYFGFEELKE